jgi:uncharacterized protein YxjI
MGGGSMKLLFKQRIFSWLDSYDIYDEQGNTVYTVKSQLAWGHCLKIFDRYGNEIGKVKERVLTFFPKFEVYQGEQYLGCITRELALFKPKYNIDYNGWRIEGNFWEWAYKIVDSMKNPVAIISKEVFRLTDTYAIEVYNPENALIALMFVLAIDAEKCSRK